MKTCKGDKTNKVLVIGLDGGTCAVLRPLIDAGKLPTLAAMMEAGSWGELASTIPPLTAPAWASFITGKNPGKHGIFQFGPIDRSLYEGGGARIVDSRTLSGGALWDVMGREGKKVGVINVPMTYPPHPVNGFMVTGMLTPRGSDHFTYPPQISSFLGNYHIDVSVGKGEYGVLGDLNTKDSEVLTGLIEELNTLVEGRTEAAIRLMEMYSPDFFMILFTETDRLQHIFWPYLQPQRLQFEDLAGRKIRRPVEHFYRHLDHNLAKLIDAAGEKTIKILMSDHGFGSATKRNVNFNVWLRDRGYLKLQKSSKGVLNPKRCLERMGLSKEMLYSLASAFFPGHVVRRLQRGWGRVVSTPIDWKETRAVLIPMFEFVGGIQIITDGGDQKQGDPQSEDYEDFRNGLIRQLWELRDPQTQEPIFREIYKREELYWGDHTADAPDIVFIMAPEYRAEKGLLSKSLITEKHRAISLWTGTHRREGIVALSGPNISRGKLPSPPQIYDLTTTILYLMGIGLPEDMDGRVIEEAIEDSYLTRHKVRYTRATPSSKGDQGTEEIGLSEEEMEKVRKHLEGLGYLS